MTDTELNILILIEESVYKGLLSIDFWVENIKLIECYSGIKTIKKYSKDNGITPQAVYKSKKYIELLDTKFVIDNY